MITIAFSPPCKWNSEKNVEEKVFPTTLMGNIYYSRLFVSNIYSHTGKDKLTKKNFLGQ